MQCRGRLERQPEDAVDRFAFSHTRCPDAAGPPVAALPVFTSAHLPDIRAIET